MQPCRRPADGRYGENPNRLQHYYQFQVLIKPSPANSQELYLGSLREDRHRHRQARRALRGGRLGEPTLGAWGLGWEVWLDGMEVTQFTYFQQVGGFECDPVPAEITYGLERLTMYIQGVDSVYDIVWSRGPDGTVFTYGDVFLENEREFSAYNFEHADTDMLLFRQFNDLRGRVQATCSRRTCRCRPTTACSSARIPSICSMPAAPSRRPSAPTTSCACAPLARRACACYLKHVVALKSPTGRGAEDEHRPAFEIGTEELPAIALVKAAEQLRPDGARAPRQGA